jgi:hypothetical protein
MLNRSRHHFARLALRPITVRQEIMNDIQIEPSGVAADGEFAAMVLRDLGGIDELHSHILIRGLQLSFVNLRALRG